MVSGEPWHRNSEVDPAALPSVWTSEAPHVIPLGAPGFLCQHWPWEWYEAKVMFSQLSGLKTFWSLKTWGLHPLLFIGAASISSHCIRDQNWDFKNILIYLEVAMMKLLCNNMDYMFIWKKKLFQTKNIREESGMVLRFCKSPLCLA